MADPRLVCAKVSFSVLAILFVVLFTIYSIYGYCMDEDWWWNTHKNFHENSGGRYPSITICISDEGPEGFPKLFNIDNKNTDSKENAKENETKISYKEFLQGRCQSGVNKTCRWDESLSEVNYDQATVPIEDYILGFSLFLNNGSKHWFSKAFNSNSSNSSSMFSSPINVYISKREADQKCVTSDIPYIKNRQIHSFGLLLNRSLFGDNGERPESAGFSVQLHYPNQLLITRVQKSRWYKPPITNGCSLSSSTTKCLDSYTMQFNVANVKAISRRNKRKDKCIKDWENYDTTVYSKLADILRCKPNHWNVTNKLFNCKERKDLEQAALYTNYYKMPEDIPLPCKSIKNIIYKQDDFTGLTTFSSLKYPQIEDQLKKMSEPFLKGNDLEMLFEFQVNHIRCFNIIRKLFLFFLV